MLLAGGISGAEWAETLLRNITGTAAAELSVPAGNVQVELSASLAAGMQLPAPTLQQQPAASQAVAEFLEAISSSGSPSVLVGVDLLRPAGDMMGPAPAANDGSNNNSSRSRESIIALGSISGLGEVTQSLRIASAMQRLCPELFIRGAAFTAADSPCAALLAARYMPALAVAQVGSSQPPPAAAAAGNATASTTPNLSTNSTAANGTANNSTAGSKSTATSTAGRTSFAVRVVMPVALNIKLSVAVRAAPGHDAESLDAAAHAWLASQDFQQLLEDQGLQTGRGTPARLVAVMPQRDSSTGKPAADGDADNAHDEHGSGSFSNKESGWFIPWKPGHGSDSGSAAAPDPQAGMPQKPPAAAGSKAGDAPDGYIELSHGRDEPKIKEQSLAVIVGGLMAATVLGAAAAFGIVAVVRRRRRRREAQQQGKDGSSKGGRSSSDSASSSRGGSSAERRARRVSAASMNKLRPAWTCCGGLEYGVQYALHPICTACSTPGLATAECIYPVCHIRILAIAAVRRMVLSATYMCCLQSLCVLLPAACTEQPWHWQALPEVPAKQPDSQQPGRSCTNPAGRPAQQREHSTAICSSSSSSSSSRSSI
jgi:hypothetical protein